VCCQFTANPGAGGADEGVLEVAATDGIQIGEI
jgi:hypothetical protein